VRDDMREHLRRYAHFLADDPAGRVLLALVGRAQHDAAMAATFAEGFLAEQREADRAMLERGVARGELPGALDLDGALDRLYGPVLYRALLGGPPSSEALIDALVEGVLGAG
jgi:AcrR family transcriptional regulator